MKSLLVFTFCLILADTDAVTTATGYIGGSIQIKCPYSSGYENYNKYLCRGKCPYGAFKDIPVKSGSPPHDRRFSLNDNKTTKVFTVTISDLRSEDGNTYWCVIQKPGVDDYTEILLQVKTVDPAISNISHTSHTPHTIVSASVLTTSSSVQDVTYSATAYRPSDANNPTTISSSRESTTFYITVALVVLVVLLIALSFAVVLQKKKKKKKKTGQPAKTTNLHMDPCPTYANEEMEESRGLANILYSELLLPSNPIKSQSTTLLPTVPQTLYTEVKHASDSPDQDSYSLVSAASPPVVKSDENPAYAEVNFNTRSNAVREEIYSNGNYSCDYATVNIS